MNQQPKESASAAHSAALESIRANWPLLPPHVREAILTLVDAAVLTRTGGAEAALEADGAQERAER